MGQATLMPICAALLKYGQSQFWVTIIEYIEATREALTSRETIWISQLQTSFNVMRVGGSRLGFYILETRLGKK
jgi:hypothetical protein